LFELSVAWKYLLPKRRQLSVSIISLISILVISLVVWLILVFFSVTRGLEKGWIEKLVALTAPVRVTPTEKYYDSHYYQIDRLSSASNYSFLSIGEKLLAGRYPYDPDVDEELPADFPSDESKDLVKVLYNAIQTIPEVHPSEYEATNAALRLKLIREDVSHSTTGAVQSILNQPMYITSFGDDPAHLNKTLLASSEKDLHNMVYLNGPEKRLKLENHDLEAGFGILLPKSFRDAGVLLGDRGDLSYFAPGASALQEQRLAVFVAGFYDPGIVPMGGKFLLTNSNAVRAIRSAQGQDSTYLTNGVNLRFDQLAHASQIKNQLEGELEKEGIAPYWKVETFREYDYAKDLLQQLSSEKNIFSLISGVIILVACSNIISMLIILVNDKKLEIGILRSMGATSGSIALIFGICGIVMGLLGTLAGTILAYITLSNLNNLLQLISQLQGYDAFNPIFYGDHLPNQMSMETLLSIFIGTVLLSGLAGLIPAIKASRMKPAAILRSE
jgi:ABC-type lipoprotein release transport system permease subunit